MLWEKYSPLSELPSGPELDIHRTGSETSLQRMEDELGDGVGELGAEGPRCSAVRVEPVKESNIIQQFKQPCYAIIGTHIYSHLHCTAEFVDFL